MRRKTTGCSDECVAIGINLKNIRLRSGLSQEGFAERVGVSRQTVVNWERGKSLPSADKITHIIKEFSLSLEDIFSDTVPYVCNERRSEEEPAEERAVEEIAACEEEAIPCAEKKNNKKKIVLLSVIVTLALCALAFILEVVVKSYLFSLQGDETATGCAFSLGIYEKLIMFFLIGVVLVSSAVYGMIRYLNFRRDKK
ncbi:MAG TPA: helix-turn-helix domain-containing protein [Candidatus Ornithoclostridium faecavium]|nr:helix-turn-helix domain-containing protein [Candidatus Ornithoclostridium faecavium]